MASGKKNRIVKRRAKTSDGLKILHDRYINDDDEMARMISEERTNMEVARKIYDLRGKAGLS